MGSQWTTLKRHKKKAHQKFLQWISWKEWIVWSASPSKQLWKDAKRERNVWHLWKQLLPARQQTVDLQGQTVPRSSPLPECISKPYLVQCRSPSLNAPRNWEKERMRSLSCDFIASVRQIMGHMVLMQKSKGLTSKLIRHYRFRQVLIFTDE